MKLIALGASLGRDSLNRRLVRTAADIAMTAGAEVEVLDLRDLDVPLYDPDVEAAHGLPGGVRRVVEGLRGADGLIFASAEYNHSVSGVAKNLLDWISRGRPYPLAGKPVLALSATPGRSGGRDALDAVRRPLEVVGARVTTAGFPHAGRRHDGLVTLPPAEVARLVATVQDWMASLPVREPALAG